jgi:GAF domain-containing protein
MAVRGKAKQSVRPRARRQSLGRKKANGGPDYKQQLAESRARQAATAEILKVIARSPDNEQPVFDAIVKHALRLLDGYGAIITRVDGNLLHLAAFTSTSSAGDAALKRTYPRPISTAHVHGRAIRVRAPVCIRDTEKAPQQRVRVLGRARGYRSLLAVPLLYRGEAIGVLAVTRREPNQFTRHEIKLLETFAGQAVIAIENVRRFTLEKEALERQTATAEILKVIASSPSDVQPVFDAIVNSAKRLIGGLSASMRQLAGETMHLAAFTSLSPAGDKVLRSGYPRPLSEEGTHERVVRSRAPLYISDTEKVPASLLRTKEMGRTRGYRSLVIVPMLLNDKVIGTISVTRREPGAFADHQIELLRTFADQAVIAIENVRLFNETKEALERQTATAEILKVIASSRTEVQPVFDAIVQSAAQLFGRRATLRLVEPGGYRRMASSAAVAGFRTPDLTPIGRESLVGTAVMDRKAVQAADIRSPDAPSYIRKLADKVDFRAGAAVPLMRDGVAIGAISVVSLEPGAMSEKQMALLATFADQAVIAIENVRQFNETKEALERQTATAEILKVIASSPSDVQPVFDAIAASAKRLLNAGAALVARREGDMLHLAAFTTQGEAADAALRKLWPSKIIGRGHMGQAVLSRGPVLISDIEIEPGYSENFKAMARTRGLRSIVSVPMLREGEAIGVISVNRPIAGKFSDHQTNLLRTFADQAVIAIENVRLFNETKEALERQTATGEVLAAMSGSMTDTQPVFEKIVRSLRRLFGTRFTVLQLLRDGVVEMPAVDGEGIESLRQRYPRPLDESTVGGRAMLTKQAVQFAPVIDNPETPQATIQFAKDYGFDSVIFTPMIHEGKVVGAIGAAHTDAKPFDERQIALIKTFAAQAVIAIENVRLFNETKEALEQQTATAGILKVISESPTNTQPVFDAIVNSASRLFDRTARIRLAEDGHLVLRATSGDLDAGAPMPISGDNLGGRVFEQRRAQQVGDTEALDAPSGNVGRGRSIGYRALAVAPLMRDSAPIGLIGVMSPQPGALTDKQMALLQTFADQAVIAIENVRLFNETKEALERQTATAEILKVIASSPSDVQPVLDAIVRSALKLVDGHSAVVTRVADDAIHLGALTSTNPEGDAAMKSLYPVRLDADVALTRAIRSAQPTWRLDTETDPDVGPREREMARLRGFRSNLFVPMVRDGKAIGSIGVTRLQPGEFPAHQVELLKTFADQAVIAIENVRLFNETKEALEQQTATAEILQVISSSPTDTQPVFEAIVQSGLRLFPDAAVAVVLPEGNKMRMAAVAAQLPAQATAWRAGFGDSLSRDRMHGAAILDSRLVDMPDAEAEKDGPFGPGVKNFLAGGNRAITIMPMICEDTAIGAISVIRATPGPLSGKQMALLRTFAAQAVIAIENVRLFNETKEALDQQTATAGILRVISSSPTSVKPVFEAILEHALRLCDASFGYVCTSDGNAFDLSAQQGLVGDVLAAATKAFHETRVAGPQTALGRLRVTKQMVHILDAKAEPAYHARDLRRIAIVELAGARTMLAMPLLREGDVIGAVVIYRREVKEFTEKQISLLQTFADQAVIAIENVRLFNETKEALERQTATAEVLNVISRSPTDVQPVFDTIVRSAIRLMDGVSGAIFISDGKQVDIGSAYSGLENRTDRFRTDYPASIDYPAPSVMAIKQARTLNVADLLEGDYPESVKARARGSYRTSLSVPMMRGGAAVGAIGVTRAAPTPFPEHHVTLLKTFADQAVIAIENVRLFKELQSRTEALTKSVGQLTALGEVGQAISSTLDLETVLQTIVSRAVQLAGLDGGSIYEYDERTEAFRLQAAENMSAELVEEVRRNPIRKGDGAVGHTAVTLEAAQVPDILDDSYKSARKELLIRAGYRAILVVPLLREDHLVGALLVNRGKPGRFPSEVVELLKTFATQSAMAIQNARLFREIEEKGKQLEEASRHKSNFLASMSHELRTPLNAILGFNEMILGGLYGEAPTDMQEPLKDIQTSGKHLLRLINNVLDLAKIEAGRMELSLQDYSVHDTVASVHSTLRPLAAEKGLEFIAKVPNDLPLAYGDGGRMTQCLMNLAGNSLKFTKAGRVEIAAEAKDGLLVYKVTDTGIGIPPDKIGSLFTEFKQTDATIASEYGGTGLGLSISRKFVEMHGGRIWVESELGKGSAFIIEVPLRVKTT